jgi:hypothetical protein
MSEIIQFPNTPTTNDNGVLDSLFGLMNKDQADEMAVFFSGMFELPDEQFSAIADIFLAEFDKALSTKEYLQLSQELQRTGISATDLNNSLDEILNAVDSELSNLSDTKRSFVKRLIGTAANAVNKAEGIADEVISLPFELCHPDAKMPSYANVGDSGMDIYAIEDVDVMPGETVLVHTGLKVAIPMGYEIQVRPKSGRCLKTKMRVANTPGTIKVA